MQPTFMKINTITYQQMQHFEQSAKVLFPKKSTKFNKQIIRNHSQHIWTKSSLAELKEKNDEEFKSWDADILTGTPSTMKLIQSIHNDEILMVPDNISQNQHYNYYLDEKQMASPLFPLNINSMNDLHRMKQPMPPQTASSVMKGEKKRFAITIDSNSTNQLKRTSTENQQYHSPQFKETYINAMADTLEFLSPHQEANIQQL